MLEAKEEEIQGLRKELRAAEENGERRVAEVEARMGLQVRELQVCEWAGERAVVCELWCVRE